MNNISPETQALLNQVILNHMQNENRKRKWQWVKRCFYLLLAFFIVYKIFSANREDMHTAPHIGLVDVNGEIFEKKPGGSENFAKGLEAAYKSSGLKALIIRINSPGGSPVQAEYMYNALKYYRNKNANIKTYAVCVDACTSAAYYIAAAADEIYASPASMVGSIGVLYNGFGFDGLMQKLGITRRLQTAGKEKGFLDAFSPENPEQKKQLQTILNLVHAQFIARVKEGRGDKLKVSDELFSGLFWTGEQAKDLGLIDGFASAGQLAHEVIHLKELVDYTQKQSVFERIAKGIGVAMADEMPSALGMHPGLR